MNNIQHIIKERRLYNNKLHGNSNSKFNFSPIYLKDEYNKFAEKLSKLWLICNNKNNIKHCSNKLIIYYNEFSEYKRNNFENENNELRKKRIDFYNLKKIDNHCHLSAVMTTNELKQYMIDHNQDPQSSITIYKMNSIIDEKNVIHRKKCNCYDKYNFNDFNNKYYIGKHGVTDNPNNLRQCLLKINSGKDKLERINTSVPKYNLHNLGKFNCSKPHYANICKKVCNIRNKNNTHLDLRISLYGKSKNELETLAKWFTNNKLYNITNVDWYIQIPRIPHLIHRNNFSINSPNDYFSSFVEWFDNIFVPIKEAYNKNNSQLLLFLNKVFGFDSVDNEEEYNDEYYKNVGTIIDNKYIKKQLKNKKNPFNYSMYLYLMWYYISDLNKTVKNKRKIFFFKPHSGELGYAHHLLTSFILCDSICHGINLISDTVSKYDNNLEILKKNKNNVLLYLYCKDKVGCALSPISNSYLSRNYRCLHLDLLFNVGLNMSINTDDPLMFHLTNDPLMEEYTMIKTIYNLSLIDLVELINNSITINGNYKKQIQLKKREQKRLMLMNVYK